MSMKTICPVFICNDIQKTLKYYVDILGFKYADHIDKVEKFAAIYRDSIEIILVQKMKGTIESNVKKYGSGEDAYICPDSIEAVDSLYLELRDKKVENLSEPKLKNYGSYEFSFEDIDGRLIGIGRIKNRDDFFKNSNYA
jgi:catechol 2,3-dioxygenase-like lactoylglutathione lyase family enzyme